jgi:hypothetical protein
MLTSPEEGIHQCLERVQLSFIKRFLGLRPSTSHWVTLAECSRLPVYMFAYKRVCRYWNKLASLGNKHLARLVFEESHQMHTVAQPTWAGLVLQLGSELGVSPRYRPHADVQAWAAVWQPPPGQPDGVVNRVFSLEEVAKGCDRCLEDWWCQWRTGVDNSGLLQQYGRLFLHRQHMDTENNYLYDLSMPVHLQQSLCMLRCFNLRIGAHCRRPGAIRTCTCCTAGCLEDEDHLLHSCTEYAELRQRYEVSSVYARRFQMHTVRATAKYIRHAMKLREDRVAQQSQLQPHEHPAGGHTGIALTGDIQRRLCLVTLVMLISGWLLCFIACLHSLLEPMIGLSPNHMGH